MICYNATCPGLKCTGGRGDGCGVDAHAPLGKTIQAAAIKWKDGWQPTPKNINALPDPVRRYIHAIETDCDPAGTIRSEVILREHTVPALETKLAEALRSLAEMREVLGKKLSDKTRLRLEEFAEVCEHGPKEDRELGIAIGHLLRWHDQARAVLSKTQERKG